MIIIGALRLNDKEVMALAVALDFWLLLKGDGQSVRMMGMIERG